MLLATPGPKWHYSAQKSRAIYISSEVSFIDVLFFIFSQGVDRRGLHGLYIPHSNGLPSDPAMNTERLTKSHCWRW